MDERIAALVDVIAAREHTGPVSGARACAALGQPYAWGREALLTAEHHGCLVHVGPRVGRGGGWVLG